MISSAIVRPPAANFADGITTAGLGPPDFAKALAQHEAYCRALESCGVEVVALEPDPEHPDSTFVEDTAVIAATPSGNLVVFARPGAPSRRGEVAGTAAAVAAVLRDHADPADRVSRVSRVGPAVHTIQPPGTLDGGDVCVAGDRVFIGISERTSDAGARQLAGWLASAGLRAIRIELPPDAGLLHLKSGLAWLGGRRLVIAPALLASPEFAEYELVPVDAGELYAANCLQLNDRVLVAAGYPRLEAALRELGEDPLLLDMSEFRKMDGGLSCLSLRLPTLELDTGPFLD